MVQQRERMTRPVLYPCQDNSFEIRSVSQALTESTKVSCQVRDENLKPSPSKVGFNPLTFGPADENEIASQDQIDAVGFVSSVHQPDTSHQTDALFLPDPGDDHSRHPSAEDSDASTTSSLASGRGLKPVELRRLLRILHQDACNADESVISRGLCIMADSCRDDDEATAQRRKFMVDNGAIQWIVNVMISPLYQNARVQSRGLRAIQNLMCRNLLARDELRRLDGPAVVCDAMRRFPLDRKVQRDGCGALLNFILHDESHKRKESLVRAGGIAVLVDALTNHPTAAIPTCKLQLWACRAIRALSKGSVHVRGLVWEAGGFSTILFTKEKNPDNSGIARAAESASRLFWKHYESSHSIALENKGDTQ